MPEPGLRFCSPGGIRLSAKRLAPLASPLAEASGEAGKPPASYVFGPPEGGGVGLGSRTQDSQSKSLVLYPLS